MKTLDAIATTTGFTLVCSLLLNLNLTQQLKALKAASPSFMTADLPEVILPPLPPVHILNIIDKLNAGELLNETENKSFTAWALKNPNDLYRETGLTIF